jgi:hypothetical protein
MGIPFGGVQKENRLMNLTDKRCYWELI